MTLPPIDYEARPPAVESRLKKIYRIVFGVAAIGFGAPLAVWGAAAAIVAVLETKDRLWVSLFSAGMMLIGGLMLLEGVRAFRTRR